MRNNLGNYLDISHTHPGAGGIPTGNIQSGNFTATLGGYSDMDMHKKALSQNCNGTMHVYEIPTINFYQFQPSTTNSLILDYWKFIQ